MLTIKTTIGNISRGEIPSTANSLTTAAITSLVARTYSFLIHPYSIEVRGETLTLRCDEGKAEDCAFAQKLCESAGCRAGGGECEAAINMYHLSLKLQPTRCSAWHDLGMVCSQIGRYSEAAKHFNTALLLDPEDPWCLVGLANILLKTGSQLHEAEQLLRRALARDSECIWASNSLGSVLILTDRESEAVPIFKEVIRRKPTMATPYLSLATISYSRGHYSECIDWISKLFAKAQRMDARCDLAFERARTLRFKALMNLADSHSATRPDLN